MGSEEFRMKLAAIAAECEDAGTVAQIDRLLESTSPTPSQDGMPPLPNGMLPCGHHKTCAAMSAETGVFLYCELCDAQSGRRDAEQCEQELRIELTNLKAECALYSKLSTPSAVAAEDAQVNSLLEWACWRWRDEVQDRPLANKHRRTLDATWRQVVRFAGGDPDALLGPSHDARIAQEKTNG